MYCPPVRSCDHKFGSFSFLGCDTFPHHLALHFRPEVLFQSCSGQGSFKSLSISGQSILSLGRTSLCALLEQKFICQVPALILKLHM
jgi:hypothetical protein